MQYCRRIKLYRGRVARPLLASILWIFVLIVSLPSDLCAQKQNYKITRYNVTDGLADNSFFTIFQDYTGFIWLGTQDGLIRYDGYTFKAYQHDANDTTSIENRSIISIFEDSNQKLWIGSNSTLSLYDREHETFKNYILNPDRKIVKYITDIAEDEQGRIWVTIPNQGIYHFDQSSETFHSMNEVIPKFLVPWETSHEIDAGPGIWAKEVLFNPAKLGDTLTYKFLIKHANGQRTFEPAVEGPRIAYGNRSIVLNEQNIKLKPVRFGFGAENDQPYSQVEAVKSSQLIKVQFQLDTTGVEPFLKPGESIDIGGSMYPLKWSGSHGWPEHVVFTKGNMYVCTKGGGLKVIDMLTGDVESHRYQEDTDTGPRAVDLGNSFEDDEGFFWISSNYGLVRFDPEREEFMTFTLDGPREIDMAGSQIVSQIAQNPSGKLVVTTGRGRVYQFNRKTLKFEGNIDLNTSRLSSLMIDRSGIIWVGSIEEGLYKIDPEVLKFPLYSQDIKDENSSYGKYINALEEDEQGNFWIAGQLGAFYHVNRASHEFTRVPYPEKSYSWQHFDYVPDLLYDHKGILWATTLSGLISYKPETGKYKVFLNIYNDEESISNNDNNFLFEDSRGDVWVIGHQLNKFDREREKFTRYRDLEGADIGGGNLSATQMVEDKTGNFWIGSIYLGLLKFDTSTTKFKSYIADKYDRHTVKHLALDQQNRLWYTRDNLGLFQFDINAEKEVDQITDADGLLHNAIQGIEIDEDGNLWISSHRGLSKYNPETGVFNHYFAEDGLQNNEFRFYASGKTSRNELMFGGQYGFNVFHPDSIHESQYIPDVVITDVVITNTSINQEQSSDGSENISTVDEIQLNHNQNDLTFKFAALDFSLPSRNKYTYKLDNYDEVWRQPSNKNSAEYTNLDPGSYRFQVKGSNRDGVWNKVPTTLKIVITPPWWEAWWAYVIYTGVILTLIWLARLYELNRVHFKNQVKVEEAKLKEREEVDRLKSNFFTNISHEFRTPLTLIIGPLKKLIQESDNSETSSRLNIMQRNATRLLKLINQLLDISKLEAHELQLRAGELDIIRFLRGILMSFHSLAEQKGVTFEFESAEDKIPIYLDRDKAEKIFSNLLSNAFKFTPASGEVVVHCTFEDRDGTEGVLVKVRDSGIGIPPEDLEHIFQRFHQVDNRLAREHEGSGIGLALTKELVDLHHGIITVTSEEGIRTEFQVFLPLGSTHLQPDEILEIPDHLEPEDEFQNLTDELVEAQKEELPQEEQSLVLVVEDNTDMRLYINDVLSSDYRVEEAFDGEMGVARAQELLPDLIVSDLMMPKRDGFQLCRELKVAESTSHIPVILLTAKAEREDRLEGLETGADDYLIKPFDSQELLIRIRNLIDQRQRLRDRFSESIKIEASEITVSSMDARFLQKAIDLVDEHLEDDAFSVEVFSDKIGLSRRQFYQKIKSITGLTPTEFVLNIRLKRAALLISEKAGSISEIAYSVGFNNLSYFARAFKKQFGVTPSKYPPE